MKAVSLLKEDILKRILSHFKISSFIFFVNVYQKLLFGSKIMLFSNEGDKIGKNMIKFCLEEVKNLLGELAMKESYFIKVYKEMRK